MSSHDSRLERYARLIVERSLDVQPGWQVLIRTQPLARPLLEEVVRLIAQRGAYPIVRLGFDLWPGNAVWALEAPEELLGELPPIDRHTIEQMDARITISAPENTFEGADVSPQRRQLTSKAQRPFYKRSQVEGFPWVGCQFPTPALAQGAEMTTEAFTEFLYGAVLRDWDAEG